MASRQRSISGRNRLRSGHHRSVDIDSRIRPTSTNVNMESIDLPERFRNNEDDEDEDDGTGIGNEDHTAIFTQRSMYGMLAATQSRAAFPSRFQQDSGSESEGGGGDKEGKAEAFKKEKKTTPPERVDSKREHLSQRTHTRPGHLRNISEERLTRSWLRPVRGQDNSKSHDVMTQSQILPSQTGKISSRRRRSSPINFDNDVPILDQKLRAMEKAGMRSSSSSSNRSQVVEQDGTGEVQPSKASKSLSEVIANIFQLAEPEEVKAEFSCWYLQNVLLEGFMYITSKHICFYAYLQKKTNKVVKNGYLGKLAKHGLRFRRYWFVLKGDIFSYHEKASQPYFPLNQVDLRYAISAELSSSTEQGKEQTEFTITTPGRIYYYRADNVDDAKEWVKQLQKVIFRSHNDGDSVKIALPIDSILDFEQNTVMASAETIKLRVIDNDETFAVDEYFFTFFNSGQEAVNTLSGLITQGGVDEAQNAGAASAGASRGRAESVAKLHVQAGDDEADIFHRARPQGEDDRDDSQESGGQRRTSQSPSWIQDSAESLATASEIAPSSISTGEDIDADMSASQMLIDEGVFRRPTIRSSPQQAPRTLTIPGLDRLRQNFLQPTLSSSVDNTPSQSSKDGPRNAQRPDLERKQSAGSGRTVDQDDYRRNSLDAIAPARNLRTLAIPIQHAMNLANAVRSQGKRMSSYLSSSPKNYIDRWSDAIVGGKRQYLEVEGLAPDDSVRDPEQDMDIVEHQRRFREHFGLLSSEKLVSTFFCWLHKTVPIYGKVYIGTRNFCFRSLIYGTKTRIVIPFKDIDTVQKQRGFRWNFPGMVLVIKGHEELFFDFPSTGLRDDCVVTVFQSIEEKIVIAESVILTKEEQRDADDAANENEILRAARKDGRGIQMPPSVDEKGLPSASVVFDDPSASVLDFTPKEPMRIVCLTIGSRGDVQPYIALCKGLKARGHKPVIASHEEFRPWVEQHGIEFAAVAGDPAELIRICVDNGMFTPSFFMEANSKFRVWLDGLLETAYVACQGADLLIESPSAMCGIHIAEAMEIPYFRAFTMPWTRTRAYPHAFAVPNQKRGGSYNYVTYTFFDNMFWQAIAGQINRWRGKTLGLGPTSLDKLQQNKVPFLYNFSPSVVVPPLDFSEWIKVTGYWFLDEGKDYTPPADLAAFIKSARDDKQKLVYIGFGSITVADSRQLTQQIIDAVLKADVRCILSKGWSDRLSSSSSSSSKSSTPLPEPILPPSIHLIRQAPHDWLFRQVDAAVHHGGAGTTGASLRAGIPTIIKPFFGDQYFFATRVADLGVGIYLTKVTASQLGRALWLATHDVRMRDKARTLGERVRGEDGVRTAIEALWRDLDYARSLIKTRGGMVRKVVGKKKRGKDEDGSEDEEEGEDEEEEGLTMMERDDEGDEEGEYETEERWTFVEKGAGKVVGK